MHNMGHDDDGYVSDGINRCHPTDVSIPGSMVTAEREIERMCAIVTWNLLQVEYNVLDKMACEIEGAQDLHPPKGRAPDQAPDQDHRTTESTGPRSNHEARAEEYCSLQEPHDSVSGRAHGQRVPRIPASTPSTSRIWTTATCEPSYDSYNPSDNSNLS
jgi:hypothetical protein